MIREGCTKKNPEKMWSFAKLPPDPPPSLAFFQKKNLPPFFLLKIASLMAETNFTLGPTSKTNKFPLLFLVIVGQNSQHKRANLNGRTPLDIYSNNFRPSVKHVLGVLEWFYMLTEKILFQNRGLAFYYPPRPPPGLAKDQTFSGFSFVHPSLGVGDKSFFSISIIFR